MWPPQPLEVVVLTPRWEARLIKFRATIRHGMSLGLRRISPFAATSVGVLALGAYHPRWFQSLRQLQNSQEVYLAAGALIGTILTLGVSLSIIPIQRAAETFTPSILNLFVRDRRLASVFAGLLLFCLLSFSFTLAPVVGLDDSVLLPIQVLVIGLSLDLLRVGYKVILRLLDPPEAVRRLLRLATDFIAKGRARTEKAADLWFRSLSDAERERTKLPALTARVYKQLVEQDRTLEVWAAELTEIAQRAVHRGEGVLSGTAISAIRQIIDAFIEARKDSLALTLADFGTFTSSADHVLRPLYEDLITINRAAVARGLENVSISVIHALGSLSEHMANLASPVIRSDIAPLAAAPLYYCRVCVRAAKEKGLDDAVLQGAAAFKSISISAPGTVRVSDVHLHSIDAIAEIVTGFLQTPGKCTLANEPLKQLLEVVHVLYQREYFAADHVLGVILEKLASLIPLAIAVEGRGFGSLLYVPLSPAYNVTEQFSLGQLMRTATGLVREDPARPRIDPWHAFREVGQELWRHFRKISEIAELARGGLTFYLCQTIQMISSIYLQELLKARQTRPNSVEELAHDVCWFNSFFWSTFQHADAIEHARADQCAEALGWIGLTFFDAEFPDVAISAVQNLGSLARSCAQKTQQPQSRPIANLLFPVRQIKFLAGLKNNDVFLKCLTDEEQKVAAKMPNWDEISAELDRLEGEIPDELRRRGQMSDPNSTVGVLIRILMRMDQENAKEGRSVADEDESVSGAEAKGEDG